MSSTVKVIMGEKPVEQCASLGDWWSSTVGEFWPWRWMWEEVVEAMVRPRPSEKKRAERSRLRTKKVTLCRPQTA